MFIPDFTPMCGNLRRSLVALAACGVMLVSATALGNRGYCDERPVPELGPQSRGRPSKGKLVGAVPLEDTDSVRILPRRHRARCLRFGTSRLVTALSSAGQSVRDAVPGTPALGVGNIARPAGGPIPPYSRSHQVGRDADIAFYQVDGDGQPVPAVDLVRFNPDLSSADGKHRFDVKRNWALVRTLLTDQRIAVKWLFISKPLRLALLNEAKRRGESAQLVARAEAVLHQPTDSRPHDDHFHLRIECTKEERKHGCR